MSLLSLNDCRFKLSEVYCCYYFRLKAEIEKIKLEYEESTSHEQQKYTSEIKVSFLLSSISDFSTFMTSCSKLAYI